ncbi:MAG TPA: GDP-L-fucose synthase [Bacteroidales bacterium]|nr:NAD-dependent epimerase/dehydratase family protein [Bacteroidales bacterium]HNR42444.1 GDP-L-fucose synthase [Bacteroidales bacterium]HPM18385.1 GDP-L-fucose synthase [Bacteroidales bacterium]HQG78572.1 GDP-L-fucose synthase [Bacteroidales bacterium]
MKKNSRIYVAGHTGLVGSALTLTLREKGYDNLLLRTAEELDLTDQRATDSFFRDQKPEYVFLAAAKVGGIVANNTLRADFIYINLMIQNNVISSAWKHGVKKLLFLGSTCIYPKNAPQPLREEYLLTSQLEYTNEPYAIAKIAGLKMCESFNIQYNTNFIAVMPTNLYGYGDNYNLEGSHVLPALLRKFHLGRCLETGDMDAIRRDLDRYPIEGISGSSDDGSITGILRKYGVKLTERSGTGRHEVAVSVWGTGTPLREFMNSKDMAEACVFIMENVDADDIQAMHRKGNPDPEFHPPHFLNIGTGEEFSIKDLTYKIKALTGFTGEIVFDTSKPDGTMRKTIDITALTGLGYKYRIPLDEGLKDTYSMYLRYKS